MLRTIWIGLIACQNSKGEGWKREYCSHLENLGPGRWRKVASILIWVHSSSVKIFTYIRIRSVETCNRRPHKPPAPATISPHPVRNSTRELGLSEGFTAPSKCGRFVKRVEYRTREERAYVWMYSHHPECFRKPTAASLRLTERHKWDRYPS